MLSRLSLLMALTLPVAAQATDIVQPVPFQSGELWGYRAVDNTVAIAPQYYLATPFTAEGTAAVARSDGWAIIDQGGTVLLRPFTVDNWPDAFSDGLARFVEDDKIGFFDRAGRKIIPAQFDGAGTFSEGLAEVCLGCRAEPEGEHSAWIGGQRGYINRTGQFVVPYRDEDFGSAHGLPLAERYHVVAFRAASGVASTRVGQERNWREHLIGAEVRFGALPTWYDGFCGAGQVHRSDESPAGIDDPNLSDLQVVPGDRDLRLNQSIVLDCGGAAFAGIHPMLMVDERVLVTVTADGVTYVILEAPLAHQEVIRLKEGLRSAGFDAGSADALVDDDTRAAIAAFAQAHGADYRFERGVITANIRDALVSPAAP